jgi:hypothetical protein
LRKTFNKLPPWFIFGLFVIGGCQSVEELISAPTPEAKETLSPVVQYRRRSSSPSGVIQPQDQAGWEIISLEDTTGGKAEGTARRFDDGTQFVVKAQVEKLPPPSPGEFYQAWLVKSSSGESNPEPLSLGKMDVDQAPGAFYLRFASSQAYAEYDLVRITLEKIDDLNPETLVMEGSFK